MNKKNSILLSIFILLGFVILSPLRVGAMTSGQVAPSPTIRNEPLDTSIPLSPLPSPQIPASPTGAVPPTLSEPGTLQTQEVLNAPLTPDIPQLPGTRIPGEPETQATMTNEFFGGPTETIGHAGVGFPLPSQQQESATGTFADETGSLISPLSEKRTQQPTPEQFMGSPSVEERTDVPESREEKYEEVLTDEAPLENGGTVIRPDRETVAGALPPVEGSAFSDVPPPQPIFREVSPAGESPTPAPVELKPAPQPTTEAAPSKGPVGRKRPRRRIQRKGPPSDEPLFSLASKPKTAEEQQIYKETIGTDTSKKAEAKQLSEAYNKLTQSGAILYGSYLEPWKEADPNELIDMNFDNKELSEFLKFISNNLNITFILDDYIEPQRAEGMQPIAQTKVTFKSTVPLTLKQVWELGLTFLEMSGFSVIPATLPRTYRVTASAARTPGGNSANREPLPTFIGSDPDLLPNNDSKIRYVYFVENAELSTAIQIIEAMKSGSSGPLIEVTPMRALILTDRSAIIKSIINILREIDSAALPETLAIIRLKHTDARQIRELYHRLIGKDPSNPVFNPFTRQRKPSTTHYFTEATRVFEEPYSNSLIVLGTRENIKRFEDFIVTYVDKSLDIPFSPLHVIQLKYTDALSIAAILNEILPRFNTANPSYTDASMVGGVRDSNKFFRPTVRITGEPFGNRLIINANYDEYLKLAELIERLDIEQPQCAIKVLILNVDLSNTDLIGTQLRNRADCCPTSDCTNGALGPNVNFQTSNVGPIITDTVGAGTATGAVTGAERLLGNLIQLANQTQGGGSLFQAGSTLVTLGQDAFGFFGLLQALEAYTRVSVLANPFFVTTHKYKAELKIGETRRTTTALVEGSREAQAQGDLSADLRIVITPQISYDDMVTLNIYVELGQFTDPVSTNRLVKKISTEALLANKEVLALGGLIRDNVSTTITKVPILGDIPLIGWLFKKENKVLLRTSLLILLCVEIIKPNEPEVAQAFTFSKITDAKDNLRLMQSETYRRDPIHRWIFKDHKDKEGATIDKFTAIQQRYVDENQREALKQSLIVGMEDKNSVPQKSLLELVKQKEKVRGAAV